MVVAKSDLLLQAHSAAPRGLFTNSKRTVDEIQIFGTGWTTTKIPINATLNDYLYASTAVLDSGLASATAGQHSTVWFH